MENINSFKIDKLSLKLNYVIDLIHFDGPLLSLFRNEYGDRYIYYWCDIDEHNNRWIIFRLDISQLKFFILKKISLKDLILNPIDGFLYIADIDDNLQYSSIYFVQPNELPEQYVPESDSYYDLDSELNEESQLIVLSHIIDDKEIIKILLKLLNTYDDTLKDIKIKLFDMVFTVHQKEKIFSKGVFVGYNIQEQSIPGAFYDKDFLIDDSLFTIEINSEVQNGY